MYVRSPDLSIPKCIHILKCVCNNHKYQFYLLICKKENGKLSIQCKEECRRCPVIECHGTKTSPRTLRSDMGSALAPWDKCLISLYFILLSIKWKWQLLYTYARWIPYRLTGDIKFWLTEGPRGGCSIGGFHREGARHGAWAMGVTGQWWQEIRKAKLGSRDQWGETWSCWHRLLKMMWRGVRGPPFCIPQHLSARLHCCLQIPLCVASCDVVHRAHKLPFQPSTTSLDPDEKISVEFRIW